MTCDLRGGIQIKNKIKYLNDIHVIDNRTINSVMADGYTTHKTYIACE